MKILFAVLIVIVSLLILKSPDEINRLKYCSDKYKNNTDKLNLYNYIGCDMDPYCKSVTQGTFKACVDKYPTKKK